MTINTSTSSSSSTSTSTSTSTNTNTNSTSTSSFWLTFLSPIVPGLLIVTTSVLIDRVFRSEKKSHRCLCQILMWLTFLSLLSPPRNTNNEDRTNNAVAVFVAFTTWGNVTIFFNLLTILFHGRAKNKLLQEILFVFPLSSWGCTIMAAVYPFSISNSSSTSIGLMMEISVWTFVGISLTISLLRLYSGGGGGLVSRFCGRPIDTVTSAIDFKNSVTTAVRNDDSQWYAWTTMDTIRWLTQQISITNDDAYDDDGNDSDAKNKYGQRSSSSSSYSSSFIHNTISYCANESEIETEQELVSRILTTHRITGDCLSYLTDTSQLVSLGLPFGLAVRLSHSITHLIKTYPVQNPTNIVHDHALRLHDHEYNTLRFQQLTRKTAGEPYNEEELLQPQQQPPQLHPVSPLSQLNNYPIGEMASEEQQKLQEQHQHLNDVMKERFGLELPKLKAADFYAATQLLASEKQSNNMCPHPLEVLKTTTSTTSGYTADTADNIVKKKQYPPSKSQILHNSRNDQLKQTHDRSSLSSSASSVAMSPQLRSNDLPGDIFQDMPLHIRKVAERRPDLLERIWNKKQQETVQRKTATTLPQVSSLLSVPSTQRNESSHYSLEVAEGTAVDNDNDDDNDDETTRLIYCDQDYEVPLIRYKSIEKSNLNIV